MKLKIACIIGYGSIGKLHYKILKKLKYFEKIYICTNQSLKNKYIIKSIKKIPLLNPDYILICSPTSLHHKQLTFLNNNIKNKIILVEKPIFYKENTFPKLNNKVYVGYDMRFNPMMVKINKLIKNKNIWSINVFCGSYLPSWRKNIDYKKSYSAIKKLGGGVAYDLSHEIDYINWLFGNIKIKYALSKKVSNLKITSHDLFILIGKIKKIYLNLTLNYYTKNTLRNLLVDGHNISLKADFINNKLVYKNATKSYLFNFKKNIRGDSTKLLHESIIKKNGRNVSKFNDGLKVLNTINNAILK